MRLPINLSHGQAFEALTDRLLFARVHVGGMAKIDSDSHAGVREGVVHALLAGAEGRPMRAFHRGELHE